MEARVKEHVQEPPYGHDKGMVRMIFKLIYFTITMIKEHIITNLHLVTHEISSLWNESEREIYYRFAFFEMKITFKHIDNDLW